MLLAKSARSVEIKRGCIPRLSRLRDEAAILPRIFRLARMIWPIVRARCRYREKTPPFEPDLF